MDKRLIPLIIVFILVIAFIGGSIYKQAVKLKVPEQPFDIEESQEETSPINTEEIKPTGEITPEQTPEKIC